MTDIEQRKAAALEAYNKWLSGVQHKICVTEADAEMFALYCHAETIRELLAPSPQAPDNEVTNAIDILEGMGKEVLPASWQNTFFTSFDALKKKAAQQPRQEWKTMESAPRDGTHIVVYHAPSKGMIVAYYRADWEEWRHIDGNQIYEPTHWQSLPEPPKEK